MAACDSREPLDRFFGIEAEMTTMAALHVLAQKGQVEKQTVQKAITE